MRFCKSKHGMAARGGAAGLLCAAGLAAAACGAGRAASEHGESGDAGAGLPECFSANECPTGWTCSEFGTCLPPGPLGADAGAPQTPEEREIEFSEPVSSERYVYVAMTPLDALARIDGSTLDVSSIPVGDRPAVLSRIPGSDGVVVLDQVNGSATIVRPEGADNDTRTVPTLPFMNRVSVDPRGQFALAWFDLNKAAEEAGGLSALTSTGSFQDVTVIRLQRDNEVSVDMSVGFRPLDVQFDGAGERAFVITEDGISVIALAAVTDQGPGIVAPIPVTDDPSADPEGMEVHVDTSGSFALVREVGLAELRIVTLGGPDAGTLSTIDLPAEPTDLDLSPNGILAYAVLRDTSQLAVIDPQADPESRLRLISLAGEDVGSLVVAADGARGLLFTNASAEPRVSVVELATDGYPATTYTLQKSVRAVGFSPSGDAALILHAKSIGDPNEGEISFDEYINRSYGYSLLDLETGFDKLQLTPVDPGPFVFSGSSPRAYVLLSGGEDPDVVWQTHLLELDTGVVRVQRMSSPPESVGVVPMAGMAFVNQRHGLGRVSFFDLRSDAMRTLTGFDLNSRVVD